MIAEGHLELDIPSAPEVANPWKLTTSSLTTEFSGGEK